MIGCVSLSGCAGTSAPAGGDAGPSFATEVSAAPAAESPFEPLSQFEREVIVERSARLSDSFEQRQLDEFAANLPGGHRVRLVHRKWYDPSKGMRESIVSLCPMSPEGKPDGEYVQLRPLFGIERSIQYRNGVKDGVERHYEGQRDRVTIEIPWKAGRVHGTKKVFHLNGKLMTVTRYEWGIPVGESKSHDEQGRLMRVVSYKDGKKDGVLTDYWPKTGSIKKTVPYRLGVVHGEVREYYSTGKVKREMTFKENSLHGVERQYEADGSLTRTRYWIDGESVSEEDFREKHRP